MLRPIWHREEEGEGWKDPTVLYWLGVGVPICCVWEKGRIDGEMDPMEGKREKLNLKRRIYYCCTYISETDTNVRFSPSPLTAQERN